MFNLIPISYVLANKKNGKRECARFKRLQKSHQESQEKMYEMMEILRALIKRGASSRPKSPKWNRLSRAEKRKKHLPSRVYSSTWSSDPCSTTHASNGSIPIRLCTTPSTIKWNRAKFRDQCSQSNRNPQSRWPDGNKKDKKGINRVVWK